jgi:hypothetical protein
MENTILTIGGSITLFLTIVVAFLFLQVKRITKK